MEGIIENYEQYRFGSIQQVMHDKKLAVELIGEDLFNQFIAAVRGSKDQPLVQPHEAAARVSAMEAIYTASQANTWVNVV